MKQQPQQQIPMNGMPGTPSAAKPSAPSSSLATKPQSFG